MTTDPLRATTTTTEDEREADSKRGGGGADEEQQQQHKMEEDDGETEEEGGWESELRESNDPNALLDRDPGWKRLYADDTAVVHVRLPLRGTMN